jgi:hypothetical protein
MVVLLNNKTEEEIKELMEALIAEKTKVLNRTSSVGASKEKDSFLKILEVPDLKVQYVKVYGPTWNKYIDSKFRDNFEAMTNSDFDNYTNTLAYDNYGDILNVKDIVYAYFEDYGVCKCKIVDITNKGVKLLRQDNSIRYVSKAHSHRIVKNRING